jgi:hypothetical protein
MHSSTVHETLRLYLLVDMTTIIVLGSNMTNVESITGKQFVLENMHAEANFVSVLAGEEELPVS